MPELKATHMARATVLLDLDDTLIVEEALVAEVFQASCGVAHDRCGVDPDRLERAVR